MITGISIENFKGIRDRVAIDLRPITLLFGANSAGKSSIIHALHYAREVFERHNLNADQTVAGGKYVDLGGFERFVHGHDLDRPIRLSFRGNTMDWPDGEFYSGLDAVAQYLRVEQWSGGFFDSFGQFDRFEVTVEIRWSHQHGRPYIAKVICDIDAERFAEFSSDPGGRRVELSIKDRHPSLSKLSGWAPDEEEAKAQNLDQIKDVFANPHNTCLAECMPAFRRCVMTDDSEVRPRSERRPDPTFYLDKVADAMIDVKQTEAIPFKARALSDLPSSDELNSANALDFASDINAGLSRFLLSPLRQIHDYLMTLRYLGPLRETPPRNYVPPKFPDAARWASGLGAWDALQSGPDDFIQEVSHWLGDDERLNAGYWIERRSYKEVDMADPLIIKLLTGRAFDEAEGGAAVDLDLIPTKSSLTIRPTTSELELRPHDVGIGISQVVPVVVTALNGERRLLAIEQPELHLHPKLQAELGDLFIEAALGAQQHIVFLETHSEHLLLRLLRRIRETADGESRNGRSSATPDSLIVYYIEGTADGVKETRLRVDQTGEFVDRWPKGFFDERAKELF